MNEQTVLGEVYRRFKADSRARKLGVRIGPGDDAALVRIGKTDVVLTSDALQEGVDFDLRYFSWADVGYKAVSAAVSDIYACGACPSAALATVGIPKGVRLPQVRELLSGMAQAAGEYRTPIVGGDVTRAPKLFVDISVAGKLEKRFISRSGARPGDLIYLSGEVGASRAALHLFRARRRVPKDLAQAHLRPKAQKNAGAILSKLPCVTAMMDVSDGLLLDLYRLCAASCVAAGIFPGRLPMSPSTRKAFTSLGLDPISEAAIGGEDYVLLFTARPPIPRIIQARYTCIGRIRRAPARGGRLYNMEKRPEVPLMAQGFLHRF
ncbi:thiamine-phosphate kinase [bacterium]|nr:thiamine-phosphate kinase [bacterium]